MPHKPITSCMDIRKLCQYIYLIWIHCNQKYNQKIWYAYIPHYFHMPLKKYACHIEHLCPTALLLYSIYWSHIPVHIYKIQWTASYMYQTTTKYVPATNMPCKGYIYATYPNYLMCIYGEILPKYIPQEVSVSKSVVCRKGHRQTVYNCLSEIMFYFNSVGLQMQSWLEMKSILWSTRYLLDWLKLQLISSN